MESENVRGHLYCRMKKARLKEIGDLPKVRLLKRELKRDLD